MRALGYERALGKCPTRGLSAPDDEIGKWKTGFSGNDNNNDSRPAGRQVWGAELGEEMSWFRQKVLIGSLI
jgi:hypothetical protein